MDSQTTQKYPRTPHCPWSGGTADKRTPADMTRFLNTPIVITEKLDGSNVMLHRGKVHPRSVTSDARAPWLAMARKHAGWRTLETPDIRLYAEDIFGVHTIDYDAVPEDRTCYVFAAARDAAFLSWQETAEAAGQIGLATVPVLFTGMIARTGELRELTIRLTAGASAPGPRREGVVIRRAEGFETEQFARNVCKVVRESHVQPDAEHWSRRWRPCALLKR